MSIQMMLEIAIHHPEVYGLAWAQLKSDQSAELSVQSKKNKALRKVIEGAVITLATFLNPEAAGAIAALKFCFLLLEFLQD